MPVSKSDIKFYLTSVEPEIEQTIYSQSLGYYPAYVPSDATASLVYPSTTLGANESVYDQALTLSAVGDIAGSEFVVINNELIDVESISTTTVTAESRSVNGRLNNHQSGDIVYGVSLNNIFNDQFNKDRKQYRCIAVRNNNATDTATGVEVFFKQKSRNATSKIRMAVEMPLSDHLSGTATGGTKVKIVDSSQASIFDDGHFKDANIRFLTGLNAGQSRIISSYTGSSGSFIVIDSLPYAASAGDTYEVDAGPSQRITSGVVKPNTSGSRITSFLIPDSDNPIGINVSGNRDHGSNLETEDVFYIWIERELLKDGSSFGNNNVIITLRYTI